jgi:hypothetical protein
MKQLPMATTAPARSEFLEPASPAPLGENYWTPDNPEARALVKMARQIARGRDVLFHGTRFRNSILASGILKFSESGSFGVSFSRSPAVAAYWASLLRDDDEGNGAIFIFDRRSLQSRYKLECHADSFARINEFEERVVARNVEIAPHMIGLVALPMVRQRSEARATARAARMQVDQTAADCSCGMRWNTCSDCLEEQHLKILDQLRRTYPNVYKSMTEPLAGIEQLKTDAG